MPDFVSFDWGERRLCGIAAQVSRDHARVTHVFDLAWPEGVNASTDPKKAGEWLQAELKKRGLEKAAALVSLPRERVVVRQLELPAAPDDELPELVRLQAATRSTRPLDSLFLDFLPLPQRDESSARDVLLATVVKETVDEVSAVLAAAEMELQAVGVSSIAAAEIAARAERRRGNAESGAILAVGQFEQRVEISVTRGDRVLMTHSTHISGTDERQDNLFVAAEISRSVVALERYLAGARIAHGYVFGSADEFAGLRKIIQDRIGCAVDPLDPLTDASVSLKTEVPKSKRGMYAGAVGMALAAGNATVPTLDFLHPRRPPEKRDIRREQLVYGGGGLAAAALIGLVGYFWYVSSLDSKIESLQTQAGTLQTRINDGKGVVAAAGIVSEWQSHNLNWLDQLRDLGQTLPGTDQLYLNRLDVNANARNVIARVSGEGVAKERAAINELNQKLVDRDLRVIPKQVTVDRDDPEYPYRFQLDVEMLAGKKQPAKKPAAPAPAANSAAPVEAEPITSETKTE